MLRCCNLKVFKQDLAQHLADLEHTMGNSLTHSLSGHPLHTHTCTSPSVHSPHLLFPPPSHLFLSLFCPIHTHLPHFIPIILSLFPLPPPLLSSLLSFPPLNTHLPMPFIHSPHLIHHLFPSLSYFLSPFLHFILSNDYTTHPLMLCHEVCTNTPSHISDACRCVVFVRVYC